MSCYQLSMNLAIFEDLVASSMFDKLPKETQELLTSLMSAPMETASAGGSMASEGVSPEFISVEVLTKVPKLLRSPRPRPTTTKEGPKTKKDKQKVTQSVRESPRKH